MLRGNRTERRDAESKALAFGAETAHTQIANLEDILQCVRNVTGETNDEVGSTKRRKAACHTRGTRAATTKILTCSAKCLPH